MSPIFSRAPLACFVALAIATPALAQDEPTAPTVLPEVTVTAVPFGRAADDIVQPTVVLSGDTLDRQRAGTLGETLQHELGIANGSFGQGAGRPVIRGLAGPRVEMLENGISSMDVSALSQDHNVTLDPAGAEQIEIIKGPATLLYGSGAVGGVVNVVDNRLPGVFSEGFEGSFALTGSGNAKAKLGSFDASYGLNNYFDGSHEIDYTYETPDGEQPNSAVEGQSGALSASYFTDAGSSIGLAASRYQTEYGLPQEETAFIDLDQTRVDLKGVLAKPFAGVERLTARLGRNNYEHVEFEAPGVPGTRFENQQTELRLEAVSLFTEGLRGTYGVQFDDRDFSAVGEEAVLRPTQTRLAGLFAVQDYKTHWGRLEAGLRTEHVQHDPVATLEDGSPNADPRTGEVYQKVSQTPLSLSLGALVDLDSVHHLRINLARAERAPAPEELFSFGPHIATSSFERGQRDHGIETSVNAELGVDRHEGRWTWTANLFANRMSDYLFLSEVDEGLNADGSGAAASDGEADRVDEEGSFDPAGELLLVDYRAADARLGGYELETRFAALTGPVDLDLRAFTDRVTGKLSDGGGDLPRITPSRAGLGAVLGFAGFDAALDVTRVSGQSRIASLETETDGYTLVDLSLGYTLHAAGAKTVFFLRGKNLGDEEARNHVSFIKDGVLMPGRSVRGGLRIEF